MQCPWSEFEKMPYKFCEEQLCGWIAQPANTWSNIGYLIAGFFILKNFKAGSFKWIFAFGAFILGISSGLFHANGTVWAKIMDLSSMLFLSSAMMALSAKRLFQLSKLNTIFVFVLGFLCTNYFLVSTLHGGSYFITEIILAVLFEFLYLRKMNLLQNSKLKSLKDALIIFALAFVFQVSDKYKLLCFPENHILTGHGVWHLMSAVCIYLGARYYCDPPTERC